MFIVAEAVTGMRTGTFAEAVEVMTLAAVVAAAEVVEGVAAAEERTGAAA